ncbi:hypothetical protein AB0A63_38430 [Lentzea sp. NPDC042327]
MKLHSIARTIAAVILGLGAVAAISATASADPAELFTPPYSIAH